VIAFKWYYVENALESTVGVGVGVGVGVVGGILG
jgi:hypothetical protein